jgi:hypothetical protein
MNNLYVYREFCQYHIGFHDDHICIASNIDVACEIIVDKLNNQFTDRNEGINIIKKEIKEFDLDIGYKKTL